MKKKMTISVKKPKTPEIINILRGKPIWCLERDPEIGESFMVGTHVYTRIA